LTGREHRLGFPERGQGPVRFRTQLLDPHPGVRLPRFQQPHNRCHRASPRHPEPTGRPIPPSMTRSSCLTSDNQSILFDTTTGSQRCGRRVPDERYRCELREGLAFSDKLTSRDVAFSFRRTVKINDPQGPASLLSTIKTIETPDAKTVVFRLKAPDATFPMKIASSNGAMWTPEVPGDQLAHRRQGFRVGRVQAGPLDRKRSGLLGQPEVPGTAQGAELRRDCAVLRTR
jgi:hypothetical protein